MAATTVVTGGAGFIGSHLCEKLVARGQQVICIDNFDTYYDPKRKRDNIRSLMKKPEFTLVEADIRDRKRIKNIFKRFKPERVIHMAALAGVRASIDRASDYVDVNINGSVSVMDASREVGVKNFLLASTSSVYGTTDVIPFTEEQMTDKPLAPYPASKKGAEVMAHAYHNLFKMNITCLRLFTAYGPRVRPDMMAYMVMDKIAKGEEITLFDNIKMRRDWTYIDDVCSGVVSAHDKPLGYEIINIGRGEPVGIMKFIKLIEKLVGRPAKIKVVPTPASEPPITWANINKAKRLLNYRPSISIEKGLKKTWEWYQVTK